MFFNNLFGKKKKTEDFKIGGTISNADAIIENSINKGKSGDPMGMLNIGISYKYGENGYEKDVEKAKRIFQAVIDIAPGSMAAGLAKHELDAM